MTTLAALGVRQRTQGYDPHFSSAHNVRDCMNYALYFSFVLTSIVVLAIPGPSFAYAMAVGIRANKAEIVGNAIGMALGGLVIVAALALGVAQLIAASQTAFVVLKTLGSLYLIFLGVMSLCSRAQTESKEVPQPRGGARTFLQGFLVETANPKALLFYVSLVPQFVDSRLGDVQFQLMALGLTFVLMQIVWDLTLMSLAYRLQSLAAKFGRASQRLTSRASGAVFITLGVALLFEDRPEI